MQASVNERELVLDMLLQITRDGEYSHIVIKNVLDKYQYLDKRERAFITRVVNGTLERMIEIDYIINQFSKVKVNKMKPVIRTILRSSVYQMKYMDSVPDSAICNEAVKLAGKRGFVNLKGFVNGVLRNIGRNLDKISYPDEKDQEVFISIKYSLPEWMVKQWLKVYDEETVKMIGKAFMEEKPLTVRFDEHKIKKAELLSILEKEGVTAGEVPEIPCALYLSGYDHLSALPSFCEGLYQVQDLSSMQVALWSEVKAGDQVLDVCAAPGGKATELAAKLHGTGLLIANDISSKRAKALLKNIELFGVENSFIVTEYPQKLQEYFTGFFDKILIDAPCSGEGMFRKEPSMVKAWEQNGPEFYAKLQEEILRQALPMLKPGGYLLYSTCTFSPLEDEGTVDKILSMDDSMEIVPMQGYVGFSKGNPAWVDSSRSEIEDCIRIFPHKLDGEGHFLALFHKKETAEGAVQSYDQRRSGLKGEEKRLFQEFAAGLAREFEPDRMESKQGMVYYMPKQLPDMKGLRFLRSGLFLGEMKKNRFEPSQSLAMALKKSEYKNCLDLSSKDERVIRYLKGETLTLTQEEAGKDNGWVLVCVDGYPLGWGKKNKSSLKNKYHSGWRMM